MDGDYDLDSASVSRLGTPMFAASNYSYSSSASADGDVEQMDLDVDYGHAMPRHHHQQLLHRRHSQSDAGSEEEDQEAVTPPPPTSARASGRRRMDVDFLTNASDDLHAHMKQGNSYSRGPAQVVDPPSLQDALLLLSFSRHVNQW